MTQPQGRVHVHLVVSEMKRSIDFYTTVLGFYYDHGIREMAWLTRDGLLLTLSPGEPDPRRGQYFGWGLSSTEELTQHYDSLHARHLRVSAPPEADGSRLYFFLYDPDDYPICFSYQPMEYK